MAEHAHTTPTPTRRTFGAGLLAVVAGSTITAGIAAGAAASVADLVPSEPDAELVRLYAIALSADQRTDALMEPFYHVIPETPEEHLASDLAWKRAQAIISDEYRPALDRAAELSATTPEGLRAKARLLELQCVGACERESALTLSLCRDLLAGWA